LVARNAATLERVAAGIQASGGCADHLAVDLADRRAADDIVSAATRKLHGLDILVNCASLTRNENFFQLTDDSWQAAFDVKCSAPSVCARAAWPALKAGRGSIVNICGIGGRTPLAQTALTGASSAALMAITKSLAQSGVEDGVQVNAINPGLIRTPRIERTVGGADVVGVDPTAALERSSQRAGAIRPGRPEDVASLVAYIISAAGEFLQGAIMDLDGGATKGL